MNHEDLAFYSMNFNRNAVAEALRYRERTQGLRKRQCVLLNL